MFRSRIPTVPDDEEAKLNRGNDFPTLPAILIYQLTFTSHLRCDSVLHCSFIWKAAALRMMCDEGMQSVNNLGHSEQGIWASRYYLLHSTCQILHSTINPT